MFGIPGKAAVTLTPAAARQISQLMTKRGASGLR
ncbi:MAG: iron-sulfur cluster assembly accessory protein, partial [Paracoccaceae bacterium]|nr:iron-sulfur cluster assembly accessory protein [Paracoccaceae bacterium]